VGGGERALAVGKLCAVDTGKAGHTWGWGKKWGCLDARVVCVLGVGCGTGGVIDWGGLEGEDGWGVKRGGGWGGGGGKKVLGGEGAKRKGGRGVGGWGGLGKATGERQRKKGKGGLRGGEKEVGGGGKGEICCKRKKGEGNAGYKKEGGGLLGDRVRLALGGFKKEKGDLGRSVKVLGREKKDHFLLSGEVNLVLGGVGG